MNGNRQEPAVDWMGRLKRLGWIGFLVFLLKGIIWLVVGYLLVK
jgi:hypothetical protein